MPAIHHCPFFKWEEKLKSHCEMATLNFPDHKTQNTFCFAYCASEDGWKQCSIAQALNKHYEGQA